MRGRGAGIWTGAFSVGQFLSPIAVTFFDQRLGGLIPAFMAMGGLAAGGVVLALLGDFRRGEDAPAGAPVSGVPLHG